MPPDEEKVHRGAWVVKKRYKFIKKFLDAPPGSARSTEKGSLDA